MKILLYIIPLCCIKYQGPQQQLMPTPENALYRAVEVNDLAQGALRRFTQCWWIGHTTFQLRGGHFTTELSPPQRNFHRHCLGVSRRGFTIRLKRLKSRPGVLNLFKRVVQLINKEDLWPTNCATSPMWQLMQMHRAYIKTTFNNKTCATINAKVESVRC